MSRICGLIMMFILFTSRDISAQQAIGPEQIIQQQIQILEQQPETINQVKIGLYTYLTEPTRFAVLRNVLLQAIQRTPDNKALVELLDWDYIQQKDFAAAYLQEVALDRRLGEQGERLMELGSISFSNEAYADALKSYRYVAQKGAGNKNYRQAKFEILNCLNALFCLSKNSQQSLYTMQQEYENYFNEFGKTAATADAMYAYAITNALYLHNNSMAIALLEQTIQFSDLQPALQAKCKLELGDIYLENGKIWDAALLYGQVEKAFREDPLGQEAKFRAAKIYFYTGDFVLAKSQLDVLKTATSELIANDALDLSLLIQEHSDNETNSAALKNYARAELLILQNKLVAARITLDSMSKKYRAHSLQDEILMASYKIDMSQKLYIDAGLKLQKIIVSYSDGIWGDDALFHLAQLKENQLNDKPEAMKLYQQLILKYPGSYYVPEARKEFRKLRGDKEF